MKTEKEDNIVGLLDEIIRIAKEVSGPPKVLINIATTSVISSSKFRRDVGSKFNGINIKKAAMCGGNEKLLYELCILLTKSFFLLKFLFEGTQDCSCGTNDFLVKEV